MPRRAAPTLWVLALLCACPAGAQTAVADRPGPFVVDVRGVTGGLPNEGFYPPVSTTVAIPARGFGFDLGGHVYLLNVGPARLGVGANYVVTRGTASSAPPVPQVVPTEVVTRMSTLAPQVSFNFGTSRGWSYLSAGLGTARITSRVASAEIQERENGRVNAINVGGGARWFIRRHVAVAFDLRLHRLGAGNARATVPGTPRAQVFSMAVGVSVK